MIDTVLQFTAHCLALLIVVLGALATIIGSLAIGLKLIELGLRQKKMYGLFIEFALTSKRQREAKLAEANAKRERRAGRGW